jgi:hypothetical protein
MKNSVTMPAGVIRPILAVFVMGEVQQELEKLYLDRKFIVQLFQFVFYLP